MPSKSPSNALIQIAENLRLAREFVGNMSYDAFAEDRRTVYAVTRCFEIVSEASRRRPEEIKVCHPDIPWRDIAAAGNIFRHDYEDVREKILWRTVQPSIEPLLEAVEMEMNRLKDQ